MANEFSLGVQVISSVNIFPESKQDNPTSVPLSIFDNATASFARCAAVWFYDAPSRGKDVITVMHYQQSLSKTLNSYRQWCGRLSYARQKADGNHNTRYQRIWLTYNTSEDLGIPFLTATSSRSLSDVLPDASIRTTSMKSWDAKKLVASELLPSTRLAISSTEDAPNISIQHTTFSCGSIAVAIQITHCLADAQSLATFANDWAKNSRAILAGRLAPQLSGVFDPQLLDSFAAGDIDSSSSDPQIQSEARALPQHRYDWYKSVPDQPWPPNIPGDLPDVATLSPSDQIPWNQWDTKAPVSHRVLHFSRAEVEHIYELASTESRAKISKHDALLAHAWSRITAARNLNIGVTCWLDITFGLRARLQNPLPAGFLGSPITHAAIPYHISSSIPSLPELARKIRATLNEFGPQKIAALLHDKAFEVAPQRLWHACLGREHILLTTWVHSGVYEVLFEEGRDCKYVEAVMPYLDGLVEVMEAPGPKGRTWIENGVDVSVYLEDNAMRRLEGDGNLWSA